MKLKAMVAPSAKNCAHHIVEDDKSGADRTLCNAKVTSQWQDVTDIVLELFGPYTCKNCLGIAKDQGLF